MSAKKVKLKRSVAVEKRTVGIDLEVVLDAERYLIGKKMSLGDFFAEAGREKLKRVSKSK